MDLLLTGTTVVRVTSSKMVEVDGVQAAIAVELNECERGRTRSCCSLLEERALAERLK